jgi:hypothetical protein
MGSTDRPLDAGPLVKEPEGQARGALQLSYKVEDDYGVVGAQAIFKLLASEGTNGHPARPLYSAPDSRYRCPKRAPRTASDRPPRI